LDSGYSLVRFAPVFVERAFEKKERDALKNNFRRGSKI
jgi:hypothetical protein